MRPGTPQRRHRRGRALLLTLVALTGGVAASGCLPAAPPPPTVAVYGDSLVHESVAALENRLHQVFPGWNVIIHAWGGLAQCDLHSDMVSDADHNHVRVAILAFVGNAGTPCATSRPYPGSYRNDANWAADFYTSRGIPLAFVATPGSVGLVPAERIVPNIYRAVGAARGISVIDFDDLFVNPATDRYEQNGPCLVGECTGYVNLRAPDGGHLCPVPGQVPCAVYSSGIVRYVDAIIQMAARLGGVTPPPRRVMTIPDPPQVTPLPEPTELSVLPEAALVPGQVIVPPYMPFGDAPP